MRDPLENYPDGHPGHQRLAAALGATFAPSPPKPCPHCTGSIGGPLCAEHERLQDNDPHDPEPREFDERYTDRGW